MGYGGQVQYDVGAGDQLSSLLAQLNDKLTALAQLRAGRKSMDLDTMPGNWTGQARGQFDSEYGPEQQKLGDLATTALRIKGQVDQANTEALQAQRSGAQVV